MAITPPGLPSLSLRESTFADDASLAIQAIAAEQSIAGLQSLGAVSQQVQVLASRLLATSETSAGLLEGRGRLQRAEVGESQSVRAAVLASGDAVPAEEGALRQFLAARGLPSDLSTKEGRQLAADALLGYSQAVTIAFNSVDNAGLRARIANDSSLQQTLQAAKGLLGTSGSPASPADLAALQSTLSDSSLRLGVDIRQQVQQMALNAQKAIVVSADNNQLGSQLAASTVRVQQVGSARIEAAQREIESQTKQLNQTISELDSANRSLTDDELAVRVSTLLDRVNSTADRLRAAFLVIAPNAAVQSVGNANAIDNRFVGSQDYSTFGEASGRTDSERPGRLRDPNRLV